MDTRTERRPHLRAIASGLFEARLSGVDFWDTAAGQSLLRRLSERRGEPRGSAAGHRPRLRGLTWARPHLPRRPESPSRKAGPS